MQLEPWEYEKGGYFFELSEFLTENLPHFDFALPFMQMPKNKKIGREPWHISYLPLADQAAKQFSSEILILSWQNEEIGGKTALLENLEQIFAEYIV